MADSCAATARTAFSSAARGSRNAAPKPWHIALGAFRGREIEHHMAQLVGGGEAHAVGRLIDAHRDEGAVAEPTRQAFEALDAARLVDLDAFVFEKPEQVDDGAVAELPAPADLGGRPLDLFAINAIPLRDSRTRTTPQGPIRSRGIFGDGRRSGA